MLRKIRQWFCLPVLFALSCLVLFTHDPALAAPRTALVIGNSSYPSVPLKNPANDAADMAAALKKLGFEVTLLQNAAMQQMEEAVREFGLKLRKGGTGLFYFAGHGVQVAGENYLVPVNAVIQSEGDVKYGCLNAGLVLAKMEDAGNGPNVVILDACRNNPFARSFRSAEAGLARMDAPTGSIIAYATAPGKVAADGEGRNGLYTQHLLRNIATPGLSVTDMFMSVREAVVRDSARKQVPWENTSLIGRFSLAGPVAAPAPATAPALQASLAPTPQPVAQTDVPVNPVLPLVRPQTAPAPTPDEIKLMRAMRLAWSAKSEDELKLTRKLATPLAAKGSIYGRYALDLLSDDEKVRQQAITRAARQGIPLGMAQFAEYLLENPISPVDEVEARAWLQKAIELGETRAKVDLGALLIEGKGGPRDVPAGERLLTEAARDLPEYNLLVGVTYSSLADKGLPKAEAKDKARAYIRRGADLGDINALMQMGLDYENGWGVPKNGNEAVYWYTRGAEKGSIYAMFYLALLLRKGGDSLPADPVAAVKWLKRASALGDEAATLQLAQMTMSGEGLPRDVQRGLGMLMALAGSGSGYAQVELGQVHERGIGVRKDKEQAYFWYVVADAGGNGPGAIYRTSLAKELTAEQRAAVEARAAKWKPKKK